MTQCRFASHLSIVASTILAFAAQLGASASPVTATQSDTFANSIGINIKTESPAYLGSPVSYAHMNNALFLARIHHVRTGFPLPTDADQSLDTSNDNYLAANGVMSDMLLNTIPNLGPTQFASVLDVLAPVASATEVIEGPNEPDAGFSFNGKSFPQSAIDFQNVIWSAVKGSSTYSNIPIIAPSMGNPLNSSQMEGMEYVSNYANTHSYHGARNPGTTQTNLGLQNFYLPYANVETANKPVIATETGNWVGTATTPALWMPPVTVTAQEKYTTRGYAEYFINGIQKTYFHELLSEPNAYNIAEQNFGLLNSDWSERPAYTALKHLTALLGDPGTSFTPGQLNYTLTGSTANVNQLLLQKRDGSFYLVLWQEVQSYDYTNLVNTPVAPVSVTLNLSTAIAHAAVYQPAVSATEQQTYTNPTSISLSVPDDLMIVQLAPATTNLPDLIVTNVGYTGNATPGAPVTFNCTVENIGPVATPAGTELGVGFYQAGSNGPMSWGETTTPLGPGQSANINADFSVALTAGSYNVSTWVDDVDRMSEGNKNNNTMLEQIVVK